MALKYLPRDSKWSYDQSLGMFISPTGTAFRCGTPEEFVREFNWAFSEGVRTGECAKEEPCRKKKRAKDCEVYRKGCFCNACYSRTMVRKLSKRATPRCEWAGEDCQDAAVMAFDHWGEQVKVCKGHEHEASKWHYLYRIEKV